MGRGGRRVTVMTVMTMMMVVMMKVVMMDVQMVAQAEGLLPL